MARVSLGTGSPEQYRCPICNRPMGLPPKKSLLSPFEQSLVKTIVMRLDETNSEYQLRRLKVLACPDCRDGPEYQARMEDLEKTALEERRVLQEVKEAVDLKYSKWDYVHQCKICGATAYCPRCGGPADWGPASQSPMSMTGRTTSSYTNVCRDCQNRFECTTCTKLRDRENRFRKRMRMVSWLSAGLLVIGILAAAAYFLWFSNG